VALRTAVALEASALMDPIEHTDWCDTQLGHDTCDCDGGRCPVCGKTGPCGFADDGTPLICATRP